MAVLNYLLAAIGILGLMMFQMYMSEKKKKKESEILRKKEEERWKQVKDEMAKRTYIEANEEYKNKEAEFFLKFEAGEKVYFYTTINIGQGWVKTDGGRNNTLMGTVLLTNKQLIILNRDDISSYKTSEIGYIDLHFKHIHIYVHGKDICFYLNIRDIALIEKLAGKLNIKVKKADELINPTPDPDFDKEIEKYW